jgi:hypothetical protein
MPFDSDGPFVFSGIHPYLLGGGHEPRIALRSSSGSLGIFPGFFTPKDRDKPPSTQNIYPYKSRTLIIKPSYV